MYKICKTPKSEARQKEFQNILLIYKKVTLVTFLPLHEKKFVCYNKINLKLVK